MTKVAVQHQGGGDSSPAGRPARVRARFPAVCGFDTCLHNGQRARSLVVEAYRVRKPS